MILRRSSPVLALTFLLASTAVAAAAASEFAVSSTTVAKQLWPSAAVDASGRAFVVWENPELGLLGRIVGADGASGAELRLAENVNLPSLPAEGEVLSHRQPAVVADGSGGFFVFWTAERSFLRASYFIETRQVLDRDLYGRRCDSSGRPIGAAFRVDESPAWQSGAAVLRFTVAGANRVAVAWQSDDQAVGAGAADGVFAQVFDASASALGPAFRASRASAGASARGAALAADRSGNLLVAWESVGDGDGLGVFAKRFNSAGVAISTQLQVNTRTAGQQSRVAVAFREGDGYLVTWQGSIGERRRTKTYAQKLSVAGARVGNELVVSEGLGEYDASPSVASTPGGFVVAWIQWDKTFARFLLARALRSSGLPAGPVFRVNSFPLDSQYRTGLSASSGRVFSVWQGFLSSRSGILGTWIEP